MFCIVPASALILFRRTPDQDTPGNCVDNIRPPTGREMGGVTAFTQPFKRCEGECPIDEREEKGNNQTSKKSRLAKSDGNRCSKHDDDDSGEGICCFVIQLYSFLPRDLTGFLFVCNLFAEFLNSHRPWIFFAPDKTYGIFIAFNSISYQNFRNQPQRLSQSSGYILGGVPTV